MLCFCRLFATIKQSAGDLLPITSITYNETWERLTGVAFMGLFIDNLNCDFRRLWSVRRGFSVGDIMLLVTKGMGGGVLSCGMLWGNLFTIRNIMFKTLSCCTDLALNKFKKCFPMLKASPASESRGCLIEQLRVYMPTDKA
ncbi:unknown protein [Desulfotalea psychrophila LSv54]|uniref:Uncharacterized protein n=1 Tax=Desulfotalea psychrophila (strain LSv54 / DSM 12343) TaxID=177439 RepID=Q6APD9_DESPS|nr:unknown protein [Desulfotalea psychrophila LSv54]